MSFFHTNPIAIAAARASAPKSTSNSPARPQSPSRKSSSGESPSTPPPTSRAQNSYFSKQKTPLRAAETVYYDAQPSTPPAPSSSVTITFSKPGVLPPLYVTSSMSDWSLHEMAYTVNRNSGKEQVIFYKDFFDAQPGQHMYRFRVGRKTWMIDEDCEVGKDSQGTQHNIIRVDKKPDSVQVPLGINSMLLASTATSDQPSLLVKADGGPSIAAKADVTIEQQKAQLTAAATDALQTKVDDLPPPHTDPAQFSELAVSPPANETLHAQGILGDAIETAILHAGSSTVTEPVNASAGSPIVDINASATAMSTLGLPLLPRSAGVAAIQSNKQDPASTSPALSNSNAPPTSMNTPKLPEAPATTSVGSADGIKQDETTKKTELDLVSARLGEVTGAEEMKDQTLDLHREPAEIVMELGKIEEVPEINDDVTDTVQIPEPVKMHHHRHSRKQELGKWASIGALLIGGAITGVLVGVFILHMFEGFDLAPVLESVERLEDV